MSRIRANTITNQNANGAPNFPDGITVTGIVTATVSSSTLSTLSVTGNATVGGTLGIGGTLTYEDVTNIDSVGLITARSGVNVSGGEVKVGTAVTVSSGGVITSGIVTATNVSAASSVTAATFHGSGANLSNLPASGKATNLVINGAMNVAQRATSSTSNGYQTIDRYKMETSNITHNSTKSQQSLSSSDTPYTLGFRKFARIALAQAGVVAANSAAEIQQRIEAQNIATSGWNYTSASSNISLQFWFRCSTNQTFYGTLYSFDGTAQMYTFSFTASGNNTWTKITKTIPGNSNLTFNTDNGAGLQIKLIAFYGTDYTNNKTLDQWAANDGANQMPDMASTWLTAGASTFDVTGFQLEVGDSATDFAQESYADTLIKCYRYFYAHKGMLWGITSAGDHLDLNLTYPVPMRATPSRTQVDTSLLFKNRLDQENSTSASTYSYPGAISPTGDFWVARPGSGDSWGINYTTTDTHAVYWHPHEGTTSYSWSAEL